MSRKEQPEGSYDVYDKSPDELKTAQLLYGAITNMNWDGASSKLIDYLEGLSIDVRYEDIAEATNIGSRWHYFLFADGSELQLDISGAKKAKTINIGGISLAQYNIVIGE